MPLNDQDAHAGHGHTHHAEQGCHPDDAGGRTATDPVCGMRIDPQKAAGSHEYRGVRYYFCSPHCLTRFKADPEQYVHPPETAPQPAPPGAQSGRYARSPCASASW